MANDNVTPIHGASVPSNPAEPSNPKEREPFEGIRFHDTDLDGTRGPGALLLWHGLAGVCRELERLHGGGLSGDEDLDQGVRLSGAALVFVKMLEERYEGVLRG